MKNLDVMKMNRRPRRRGCIKRWCIFGPTSIPSTAHPTYKHVVLTAVVGRCTVGRRSNGYVKNSIFVRPTYFKLSLGQVIRSDGPFL